MKSVFSILLTVLFVLLAFTLAIFVGWIYLGLLIPLFIEGFVVTIYHASAFVISIMMLKVIVMFLFPSSIKDDNAEQIAAERKELLDIITAIVYANNGRVEVDTIDFENSAEYNLAHSTDEVTGKEIFTLEGYNGKS